MSRSHILGIFFISLALRLSYILLFFSPAHLEAEDQLIYLSLAEAILQGNWSQLTPERTLGYPFFLAGAFYLLGKEYLLLLTLQALIDSLTCVFIGLICYKTFRRGFILGGIISAINLNMIVVSSMALTETLFLFLFTLALVFCVFYLLEQKASFFLASITLFCLATLVRSPSYYLLPLLLTFLLGYGFYRGLKPRKSIALAMMSLLVIGTTLGPQHWRNWQMYQATGFTSQAGTHLIGWVVPAVYQYSGLGGYDEGQALARSRLDGALENDGLDSLPVNPFDASIYQTKIASSLLEEFGLGSLVKAWVVGSVINMAAPSAAFAPTVRAMDHPSFYATPGDGAVEKIWNYLTDTRGSAYLSILIAGTLTSLVFFSLSFAGWWRAYRDKEMFPRSVFVLLTFVGLYFVAITGPIIGSKYRLPIEPAMTVFAVFLLLRVAGGYQDFFRRSLNVD